MQRLEKWVNLHRVTSVILFVCVLIWVLELILGEKFYRVGIFEPHVALSEPWRFVTSMFMHNWESPFHLFFNMFALVSAGSILERMFGTVKYIALFALSGIAGNITMLIVGFMSPGTCTYNGALSGSGFIGFGCTTSLGASGAIFGLFGALIVLYKHLGANASQMIMIVGINLVIGISISNIAWQAHVGGLIVGVIVAFIMTKYTKIRYFAG